MMRKLAAVINYNEDPFVGLHFISFVITDKTKNEQFSDDLNENSYEGLNDLEFTNSRFSI